MTKLNLTVIRSSDIHMSVEFYKLLDLEFELHSHGKGPEHYATLDTEVVFEIYPATLKMPVSVSTRIGFSVCSCIETITKLKQNGFHINQEPKESPWGMRAVARDPDGHSVEIISIT